MPVMVAVDAAGASIHIDAPSRWRRLLVRRSQTP